MCLHLKSVEHIVENTDKQWFANQATVARIFGCSSMHASAFLSESNLKEFRVGQSKLYYIHEVLEAAEKRRAFAIISPLVTMFFRPNQT